MVVSEHDQEMSQLHTADQPMHRIVSKEETQNTSSHMTARRRLKQRHQLSLPRQDSCKTRKDTEYCTTEHMRGSRKFCQRGSNFFLVDEEREDPK